MILYLILINALGLLSMYLDKYFARKRLYRISEKVLILIGVMGGAVGSMVGMYKFRHKTKHSKFAIGLPIILVIQIVLIIMYFAY